MADYKTIRSSAGSRSEVIDSGLRAHMNKVYGTMSVGMLITALAAWAISGLATTTDPSYATAQMANGTLLTALGSALYLSPLRWIIMLAPLGILFFGLWACNAQIIGSCSAVTVLCFRITDWCFIKFYFYCVYFGINSSNLFGNFHSICRFVIVGLHDEKRYLGMGCLPNNGRNWYNHSVDYKYFLRVASSYVCDFHYWITCVCRPYCIRHSKH